MPISDWSSDVCSSDLGNRFQTLLELFLAVPAQALEQYLIDAFDVALAAQGKAHDRLGRGIEAQQHRFLDCQRQMHRFELATNLDARLVHEIGRAWCRARVCQEGEITVVDEY